ncbi:MAG: formimidoylglutamate deiminase [Mycobacteriales bacterium]|nr:MAG: formimidoylglutamate deiminase [Pseudonocardiales bacterium]
MEVHPPQLHAEFAWIGDAVRRDVLIDIEGDRFETVAPDTACPRGVPRLRGLSVPGFANAHSHAFHRALRGRTQAATGNFWTWREQMYGVAAGLDPDSYLALARATYAEMVLAGFTCVGEFHYLHHDRDGTRYADPNAMSAALAEAARTAGIRLTLLDTCYLRGGIGAPLDGVQHRFDDGSADDWASRVSSFRPPGNGIRVGAAVHSVRAVPREEIGEVARWAAASGAQLHVHVSEQQAENDACVGAYGLSPVALLDAEGALGPRSVAVHAVRVDAADIATLAASGTAVCACPTTERDLADGVLPAGALAAADVPMCLGTDSHAVVDPLAEARALEMDERLASGVRGTFPAAVLLSAASPAGHRALGWTDAGRIAPGALADVVTIGLESVRLAGAADPLAAALFAGTAADVHSVVVGGRLVVDDGQHLAMDDVARSLATSIAAVTT